MATASITIRLLHAHDAAVLDRIAPDVFDYPVDARWTAEFFADTRHHLLVALDGPTVVGMATGVHYVHPDKAPQLFINEVGVAPTHQRRGIGRQLLDALLTHARTLGCEEAWCGTELSNRAARALYTAARGEESSEPFVIYTFPLTPEA